jgi:glutamine synthetase
LLHKELLKRNIFLAKISKLTVKNAFSAMKADDSSFALWHQFLSQHEGVEFVWLQYMGLNGNLLGRAIPVPRFTKLLEINKLVSLPRAVFYLLPHDHLAEGGEPVGAFGLKPDLSTIHLWTGATNRAVITSYGVQSEDGTTPIAECPRSALVRLSRVLTKETGFYPLIGFEIEVVFMQRAKDIKGKVVGYETINENHSFQSMTTDDNSCMELVEDVARSLLAAGIEIEQFHAEAAPGQWEFVLPPNHPVEAVDTLIRARTIISLVAEKHDHRATLHPRPSEMHAGSGAHVHISINEKAPLQNDSHESFFAGIMIHLPAILAFTLAQPESYRRVMSGIWSGGEYAAWGWENKETALRRVENNRFEIKLMDGLANPYLAISAMFAAGIDGLRNGLPLVGGPCRRAANLLSLQERKELGIHALPKTLSQSLSALEADTVLCEFIGQGLIEPYLAVKKGEIEQIKQWTETERRNYLISRY